MSTSGVLKLVLVAAAIIWYIILWGLGLLGCWSARKRYRLRPRSPLASAPSSSVPGVSILRPLKGLDTNLYENLESTFTQEYPNYELFLCIEDEHDQALSVVRDLIAKYPSVNAHLVIGAEAVGVNPKVNNLMPSYHQAAHDILWVIDSNVMVAPGTLARSVDALDSVPAHSTRRRIGLVHHVPFAWATEYGVGSRIEEAFLNTNHAKMYIAINTVAIDSCVVGKSNLYRRSDLERVDGTLKPASTRSGVKGFPAFGRFLAEDNMIASALWHELGLRHELSCDVAQNAVGRMSLADYVWRRVRWVRVRKRMVLAATLLEPLTESVLLGVIVALALRYLLGVSPFLFFPLHIGLWLAVDFDVYASLAEHPVPASSRWIFVGSWATRELLALPIWLLAIFGDQVEWRGKKYEIMNNGEVRRVTRGSSGGMWSWLRWGSRKEADDHYEPLAAAAED
ncbi:Ceramide glucosyltransferase [Sparassis crispa]|uniref:Ceramide glucosyltransferase n=1 Tax=Sparassis crispa TaxID=139825 RepID=A0A401G6G9_9APHY|nr:Ceramide glucosyltransferase [Sparassis crispa]GBE77758.1 Ceramide glucosyltransferase [Sparassis crispa]